jgi:hypothetical protein
MTQEATVNPNDRRNPPDNPRPESQPHGTTEDQINEMESEGQGSTAKEDPKPESTPPPNRTTVSIPSGTVVK